MGFANEWMGITQDPFVLLTIQGHMLQFNQKLPLVKPTHNCEVKVPKTQESMMTSEVRSILSKGATEVGPGDQEILHITLPNSKENGESHFIMNLKLRNQFITCTKFKMTTLKQIREDIHPGQWAFSLNIKSAFCHIPIARRHHCLLCFRWKGKVYWFRTLPFSLSTAPKTFMKVKKPILHLVLEDGYKSVFIPG